jgi:hypothetical protein
MKRFMLFALLLALVAPLPAFAGGLEDFLSRVNIQARVDLPEFSTQISAQFGAPLPKVQAVVQTVREPADAFMVFQLAEMSGRAPERVMEVYSSKKGWGAMAQELGIKPGSADFHALKNGDLSFTGKSSGHNGSAGPGKGKGKGHK